jgi:valyl-tRNA synthetase
MCDGKNHPLVEVSRTNVTWDVVDVVRWCPDCGAIVVDVEIDGRVSPGEVMKMRFPKYGGNQK